MGTNSSFYEANASYGTPPTTARDAQATNSSFYAYTLPLITSGTPIGPEVVTLLGAVQRSPTSWTFTFQRTGGDITQASSHTYVVSGSPLNGPAAVASDFGGTFPSGTLTFAPGSTTTTVTITPTDFVEPN